MLDTHASGVVMRNERMTSGVRKAKIDPTLPRRLEKPYDETSRPIRISAAPSPSEKA
jgi:hypothetical protein